MIFVTPTRVPKSSSSWLRIPPPAEGAQVSGVSIPDELLVKLRGRRACECALGGWRDAAQRSYTFPLSDGPRMPVACVSAK